MRQIIAATLATLIFSACAQMTFTRKAENSSAGHEVKFAVRSLVWGYTPLAPPLAADTTCGQSSVEAIQMEMNTTDVIFSALTFGFYVPQRVTLVCK